MGARFLWTIKSEGADSAARQQEVGAMGADACDAALGDPALKPEYTLRRANLLRARALHRLAMDDTKGAFADLDAADGLLRGGLDPYAARSLKLGVDLVRAYALRRSGDGAAAADLALRTFHLRPYSRQVALSALAAMGPKAPRAKLREVVLRMMQLDPRLAQGEVVEVFVRDKSISDEQLAVRMPDLGPRQLFNNLPDAETRDRVAVYKEAKKPLLAAKSSIANMSVEGFHQEPSTIPGATQVQFRTHKGSPSMTEEAALLYAADQALQANKPGFLILARRDVHNDLKSVSYGQVVGTSLLSRQTLLDVIYVDPAAMPADHAQDGWRVMDARQIHDALTPIYNLPQPTVPAQPNDARHHLY